MKAVLFIKLQITPLQASTSARSASNTCCSFGTGLRTALSTRTSQQSPTRSRLLTNNRLATTSRRRITTSKTVSSVGPSLSLVSLKTINHRLRRRLLYKETMGVSAYVYVELLKFLLVLFSARGKTSWGCTSVLVSKKGHEKRAAKILYLVKVILGKFDGTFFFIAASYTLVLNKTQPHAGPNGQDYTIFFMRQTTTPRYTPIQTPPVQYYPGFTETPTRFQGQQPPPDFNPYETEKPPVQPQRPQPQRPPPQPQTPPPDYNPYETTKRP